MASFNLGLASELSQLEKKIEKLNEIFKTEEFAEQPERDRSRMITQRQVMKQYAAILETRIKNVKKSKA